MSVMLIRQELYDRVWEEPVDTFAKEYGLSNVASGRPAAATTFRFRRAAIGRAEPPDKSRGSRYCRRRKTATSR